VVHPLLQQLPRNDKVRAEVRELMKSMIESGALPVPEVALFDPSWTRDDTVCSEPNCARHRVDGFYCRYHS
jgi:hypothetical protein